MNAVLLIPAALAALAALVLPLLLHLVRRDQMQPTPFAALRWLLHHPRPRRRIRLDEWPLLLVRLLLLALLALWLARPAVPAPDVASTWTVVAPGVDVAAAREAMPGEGELRWLADGFPELSAPPPEGPVAVSSLLRELDAALPPGAALRVLVPAQLQGVDGQRPRLSREVDWQVVGGEMDPPVAADDVPPPALVVRHDAAREPGVRYLRAAAKAWAAGSVLEPARFDDGPAAQPFPEDAQYLAWLVAGPLPAAVRDWLHAGGTLLADASVERLPEAEAALEVPVWRDGDGTALAVEQGVARGRMVRLLEPLQPETLPQLFEPEFPRHLRALLVQPPPHPQRVRAADHAPLAGAAAAPLPPRELRPWLGLLVALVFLLERWLAAAPRRRVAA